jgi:hypothetical protein
VAALAAGLISGAKNKNSPCKKREGLAEKRRKIPLVRRGRRSLILFRIRKVLSAKWGLSDSAFNLRRRF